jgi:hypothetical protein
VSFASVGPRAELRDTIRSTGAHRVILDALWSDVRGKPDLFPELVYAEAYDGTEVHLAPPNRDRILRAWDKYDHALTVLPVRITVNPTLHLELLGEAECEGCGGTGDAPDVDDGMDDRDPCICCTGRGVQYAVRAA